MWITQLRMHVLFLADRVHHVLLKKFFKCPCNHNGATIVAKSFQGNKAFYVFKETLYVI